MLQFTEKAPQDPPRGALQLHAVQPDLLVEVPADRSCAEDPLQEVLLSSLLQEGFRLGPGETPETRPRRGRPEEEEEENGGRIREQGGRIQDSSTEGVQFEGSSLHGFL